MDQLPPEFAPGGRYHRRLLRVLDRAYTAHGANHDAEIGCDGYTFGTGVWRGAWFFAGREFEGIRGADPLHPGNAFFIRFTSPDCRLFLYRDRGKGDIDKRYPFSGASGVKDRIAENNFAYQATFSFMADVLQKQRTLVSSGDRGSIPDLVLLHRGSPAEGLTRAAIGLPLSRGEADSAWILTQPSIKKASRHAAAVFLRRTTRSPGPHQTFLRSISVMLPSTRFRLRKRRRMAKSVRAAMIAGAHNSRMPL